MKGNNELKLNEATIIDALQEYLDKRYTPHVTVTAVKASSSNYNGVEFTVLVSQPEKSPALEPQS